MNTYAIRAIYKFELARTWRTLMQSIASPVISTSLYFVVFGSAIGGRIQAINGVPYGAFIVPGLIMLTVLGQSVANASFGIYFPRFENIDRVTNPDFLRGYNVQGAIQRHVPPPGVPALFGFMGQGEMLPRYENTISLSSWLKDAWGIPAPHVHIPMGENELKMTRSMVSTIMEMVRSCGFEIDIAASRLGIKAPLLPHDTWFSRMMFRFSYKFSLGLGAAIHECGGARMGDTKMLDMMVAALTDPFGAGHMGMTAENERLYAAAWLRDAIEVLASNQLTGGALGWQLLALSPLSLLAEKPVNFLPARFSSSSLKFSIQ